MSSPNSSTQLSDQARDCLARVRAHAQEARARSPRFLVCCSASARAIDTASRIESLQRVVVGLWPVAARKGVDGSFTDGTDYRFVQKAAPPRAAPRSRAAPAPRAGGCAGTSIRCSATRGQAAARARTVASARVPRWRRKYSAVCADSSAIRCVTAPMKMSCRARSVPRDASSLTNASRSGSADRRSPSRCRGTSRSTASSRRAFFLVRRVGRGFGRAGVVQRLARDTRNVGIGSAAARDLHMQRSVGAVWEHKPANLSGLAPAPSGANPSMVVSQNRNRLRDLESGTHSEPTAEIQAGRNPPVLAPCRGGIYPSFSDWGA